MEHFFFYIALFNATTIHSDNVCKALKREKKGIIPHYLCVIFQVFESLIIALNEEQYEI